MTADVDVFHLNLKEAWMKKLSILVHSSAASHMKKVNNSDREKLCQKRAEAEAETKWRERRTREEKREREEREERWERRKRKKRKEKCMWAWQQKEYEIECSDKDMFEFLYNIVDSAD